MSHVGDVAPGLDCLMASCTQQDCTERETFERKKEFYDSFALRLAMFSIPAFSA